MPAVSKAQRQAMAIAEHHPEKAKGAAKEMAKSMTKSQLHDFATTPEKNLPEHVEKKSAEQELVEKVAAAVAWRRQRMRKVAESLGNPLTDKTYPPWWRVSPSGFTPGTPQHTEVSNQEKLLKAAPTYGNQAKSVFTDKPVPSFVEPLGDQNVTSSDLLKYKANNPTRFPITAGKGGVSGGAH